MDSLTFVFKLMKKKHVQKINLFDIPISFETTGNYSLPEEFALFETACGSSQYTYEVSECEKIIRTGKELYTTDDFCVFREDDNEIRRFVRYESEKEENKFGVETIFYQNEKTISLKFSKGILKAYGKRLVLSQYLGIERLLLQKDGFLLHASLIKYGGAGIAFSAPSGTGKSTQAELWETYREAEIINGDRAGIRRMQDGSWLAYGSPMAGSSGIVKNERVCLQAIVVLRQAKENEIERMKPSEAFKALYSETLLNKWDSDYMLKLTELLINAAKQLPVYLLKCRPEKSAVELLEKELGSQGE